MRSAVVVVVLVVAAGCHSSPRTPTAPATKEPAARASVARVAPASAVHPDRVMAREVLAAMSGFTDEACACTDAACVAAVQERMSEWAAPRLPRIQEVQPTDEENARAEAIQVRMQGCLAELAPPVMPLTGTLILDQLRNWKDQICACDDKPCVADVQQRMLAWAMENMDAMKGVEPTADEDAEAERIDSELATCIARIDGATP